MALESPMLSVPFLSVGDDDHVEYDVIHPSHIFKPRSRNIASSPLQPILGVKFFIRMRTWNVVDEFAIVWPASHVLAIHSFQCPWLAQRLLIFPILLPCLTILTHEHVRLSRP